MQRALVVHRGTRASAAIRCYRREFVSPSHPNDFVWSVRYSATRHEAPPAPIQTLDGTRPPTRGAEGEFLADLHTEEKDIPSPQTPPGAPTFRDASPPRYVLRHPSYELHSRVAAAIWPPESKTAAQNSQDERSPRWSCI